MTFPAPGGMPFVTDAGLETDLIFNRGYELPEFAAFPILETERGQEDLSTYYRGFAAIARAANAGLILNAPTWRANPDWGKRIGYGPSALNRANRSAIAFMRSLRDSIADVSTIVISGAIGPRGDGYLARDIPTVQEAEEYHRAQIESFAAAGADLIEAMTITNMNEAAGIVLAANAADIPVGIMFTVETDGRLPDGTSLRDAIERVDSNGSIAFFGVNCAHPDHIRPALVEGDWLKRIAEIRPNASSKSHAELDEAVELDAGDFRALADGVNSLRAMLSNLSIVGGCCGTDRAHVAQMWMDA